VIWLRIIEVPTSLVLRAFFHFRVESSHGYANAQESAIDFFEAALDCEKCNEILEQFDEARGRVTG